MSASSPTRSWMVPPAPPQGGRVVPVKDCFVGEELKNKRIRGDYGMKPRPMFTVNDCATAHLVDGIDPNGYFMCNWD